MAGRIFEITVSYMYYNQQCINRWNYTADVSVGTNTMSNALAVAFGSGGASEDPVVGSVLDQYQRLVSATGVVTDMTVRDLYSDFDFVEVPLGFNGITTGEGMSPAMAYGFYSERVRLDIRRGFKRIPGVGEGAVQGGGVLFGTGLANVVEMAVRMSLPLNTSIGGTPVVFTPCVMGKEKYQTNPGETPAKWAYKQYDTETEQLEHLAIGGTWTPYPQVRTQNSRQYNRGR